MNNKEIIEYKNSIFLVIKRFFSKIFRKNENGETFEKTENQANINSMNISSNEIKENDRIMHLKFLYDNGQLDDEEISDEDAKKLVKLYEEETKRLNEDTKVRLNNIEKMMKPK